MNKHTIERISTVTLAQITARLQVENRRVIAAAKDMGERSLRRGTPPVYPPDMPVLDTPIMPPPPKIVGVVTAGAWNGFDYSGTQRRDNEPASIHHTLLRVYEKGAPSVSPQCTAAQMVEAIEAASIYATTYERAAVEYREATAKAIETHVAAQHEAVKRLAGMVAI